MKKEKLKDYGKYLRFKHWYDVKERFKKSKLHKGCCYCCSSKKNLHLHHKTYKRLGKERLNDLIYLCDNCHSEVHLFVKNSKSMKVNLWNGARKYKKKLNGLKKKKHLTKRKKNINI